MMSLWKVQSRHHWHSSKRANSVKFSFFSHIALLLCSILLVGPLYAQDGGIDKPAYQEVLPQTPETAAIGVSKAAVDTYSGLMSQTIPIYTVSLRELSVPISLSYTAQSPNVQQIAGWVGLGWNLNAGGAIIRQRRGIEDDFIYDPNGTGIPDSADPETDTSFIFPGIPDSNYAKRRSGLLVHAYYNLDLAQGSDRRKAQGIYESQPDLFTLSIPGYSAQFMFDASANLHVISDTDLKIEAINYDISNPMALSTTYIPAWRVTVPGGTVYEFRAIEKSAPWRYDSTEPSNRRWKLETSNAPDAWLLTKITSRESGLSIDFEYEDYEYDHYVPANETQFRYGYASVGDQTYNYALLPELNGTIAADESRVRIYGKRLKNIRTSTGRTYVDFRSSPATARRDIGNNISAEVLDAIVVKHNPVGDGLKQLSRFDFTYDQSTGRLTLRKVGYPL